MRDPADIPTIEEIVFDHVDTGLPCADARISEMIDRLRERENIMVSNLGRFNAKIDIALLIEKYAEVLDNANVGDYTYQGILSAMLLELFSAK